MTDRTGSLAAQAASAPPQPFPIPGATPGGVTAELLNVDAARGLVAFVIHMAPGATIPAHFHLNGAEAHFVLEGDFVDAETRHGPGAYLTHPARAVHGPHGTTEGCRVLTLQTAFVDPAQPDFHIADAQD